MTIFVLEIWTSEVAKDPPQLLTSLSSCPDGRFIMEFGSTCRYEFSGEYQQNLKMRFLVICRTCFVMFKFVVTLIVNLYRNGASRNVPSTSTLRTRSRWRFGSRRKSVGPGAGEAWNWFGALKYGIPVVYPLVNIQKTMENHHFLWVNQLSLSLYNYIYINGKFQ